jgi:hypothetical protein
MRSACASFKGAVPFTRPKKEYCLVSLQVEVPFASGMFRVYRRQNLPWDYFRSSAHDRKHYAT